MPVSLKSLPARIFYLLAILTGLCIFFFKDSMSLFPAFIHAWTQSDRYALALGFLNNGFDFFHPQTFNLATINGITAVDFPIHEYMVAIAMKISGVHEPVVFRSYNLAYGLTGLVFLFLLSQLYTGSFLKSLITVLFLFLCPVFLYYLNGFIPSIPSVSNVFIGYYFYFRYKKEGKGRYLKLALLFLTLAAMARQPFFIFLFSVFCQEIFQAFRKKYWSRVVLASFAVSFLFFFGYQVYNYFLREQYGSRFLNSFLSAQNFSQFKDVAEETWLQWRFHYFNFSQYIIFGILILVYIIHIILTRQRIPLVKDFQLQFLIAFAGCVLYFILMIRQFPDHDYYFIDSLYTPLVFGFIILMGADFRFKWLNYLLMVVIAFFLYRSTLEAKEIMKQRYETYHWDKGEITRQNFLGSGKFLDSIGVDPQAKVLVLDAYTTNIPLILMNRMGWTLYHTKKEYIDSLMTMPFDLVALQNCFIPSGVLKNDPDLLSQLEKFADNGTIGFYKRNKLPPQSIEQFLGITEDNIQWKFAETFDEVGSSDWWSALPVSEENFFSGPRSLMLTPANETADMVVIPRFMLQKKALKIMVTAKIMLDHDLAPSLNASFSENEKVHYYQSFDLKEYTIKSGEWQDMKFQFVMPPLGSSTEKFVLYFWNSRHGTFYMDDLSVTAYH